MNGEQLCFMILVFTFVSALAVLGPLYAAYERARAEGASERLRGCPGFVLRLFGWVVEGETGADPAAATPSLADRRAA